MAYKLKLDENKNVVVQDGKPVYVKEEDGTEIAFDATMAFNKHHQLNEENKEWRLKYEEVAKKAENFKDIDLEQVKKNAEIAQKFKENEMVQNEEVEKLKAEIIAASEKKLGETEQQYQARLDKAIKEAEQFKNLYHKTEIGNKFANSAYINEKLDVPPDWVEAKYGKYFQLDHESGKIRAIGEDGRPMLSEKQVGTEATFEEAIELLVKNDPHKDRLLKNTTVPGGGMGNNGRGMTADDAKYFADPKVDPTAKLNEFRKRQNGGN